MLSGLLARHWTNFYRFLRSSDWNPQDVSRVLYRQCLDVRVIGGRVLLGLDDPVCAKFGRCFAGLSTHHDPMNKAHPKHLSHGHCFVCLAALAPQGAAHWVALFVSCALYIQKKACGKTQPFATKLQLAVPLLDPLPAVADRWLSSSVMGHTPSKRFSSLCAPPASTFAHACAATAAALW